MAIWDRKDNWLAGIGTADHTNHTIKGGAGELTVAMVQQAFDVTYGKGRFNARDHGGVITVFSVMPLITKIRGSLARAHERGDQGAIESFTAMLAKYEDQIQKPG